MTLLSAVETSAGLLEMGGASAQIAFLPEGDPLANMFPVTLNGVHYKLYAHSYWPMGRTILKNGRSNIYDRNTEEGALWTTRACSKVNATYS